MLGAAAVTYALRSTATSNSATSAALPYEPHELVVGYRGTASALLREIRRDAHIVAAISIRPELTPDEQLLTLASGVEPAQAASRKSGTSPVSGTPSLTTSPIRPATSTPTIRAAAARSTVGRRCSGTSWPRTASTRRVPGSTCWRITVPGAKGVVVAVVDTGVAFRNWHSFKRSPDFDGTRFKAPCDLVLGSIRNGRCTDPDALDRESHGTFVAGEIAEATNNNYGLTGLAYQATIMPVRVLDAEGNGDSSTIAAGIRYAVAHGAQVINLSIEFSPGTTAARSRTSSQRSPTPTTTASSSWALQVTMRTTRWTTRRRFRT